MLTLLLLLLPPLLLLPLQSSGEEVRPNLRVFNRTCSTSDNLEIRTVCKGISNDTFRLFGGDFGEHYVREKVESRVFAGIINERCQVGEYCVHLQQVEPTELEEKLLLNWREPRIRRQLCSLLPCLSAWPACGSAKRPLTSAAIALLCSLTSLEAASPTAGSYCLEGGVDLLQYAFAELDSGNSTEAACDCVNRRQECRPVCRQMIYKLNCLYSFCPPFEKEEIAKFPAWHWYFSSADALKRKYNVTFCERPIETSAAAVGKGPVIYASFNAGMSGVVLSVVMTIVLVSLAMVGITCVCWQRIFLARYSRDRVEYSEVKGSL